jgi:hypothetical protein
MGNIVNFSCNIILIIIKSPPQNQKFVLETRASYVKSPLPIVSKSETSYQMFMALYRVDSIKFSYLFQYPCGPQCCLVGKRFHLALSSLQDARWWNFRLNEMLFKAHSRQKNSTLINKQSAIYSLCITTANSAISPANSVHSGPRC